MKVAVIPNPIKDRDFIQTNRLLDLLTNRGVETVCASSSENIADSNHLYENADAVIILGGDGTILCAAAECAARSIPVMGINLGRVGFMTETEQDDMEQAVDALLAKNYQLEERMMMHITLGESEYIALNDCVVAKPDSQMIKAGVFADGEQITEYIADGVIIATPTGSTGYSLSAGGPVADPTTEMFLATPICAHTLKARPAVLSPERKVTVQLLEGANCKAELTVDGVVCQTLSVGDEVVIQRHNDTLKLIKFGQQSFYDILTAKLL